MLRKLMTTSWAAGTVAMLAAVAACLWLCRWQWERFESVTGSWQNLAYTVQWPIFAGFAVYVWWHLLRDDVLQSRAGVAGAGEPGIAGTGNGAPPGPGLGQARGRHAEPDGGAPASAASALAGLDEADLAVLPAAARRRLDRQIRPDGRLSAGESADTQLTEPELTEADRRGVGSAEAGPAGVGSTEAELSAYNRYLAGLNGGARPRP